VYPAGAAVDLLAPSANVFAWTDKASHHQAGREQGGFHVQSEGVQFLGIAMTAKEGRPFNLSGGRLRLSYRFGHNLDAVTIAMQPDAHPQAVGLIPKEIFTRFGVTRGGEGEIDVPLPATPGLTRIKEVVIVFDPGPSARPVDLTITRASCAPIAP